MPEDKTAVTRADTKADTKAGGKSETYYAQTDIVNGEDTIEAGSTVSESDVGKDAFAQMVESGAVKTEKPEETLPTGTTIGPVATVDELEEEMAASPASKTRSAS